MDVPNIISASSSSRSAILSAALPTSIMLRLLPLATFISRFFAPVIEVSSRGEFIAFWAASSTLLA